ncbi:hypothetical protein FHW84_002785 [Dyella sp. SG562]|uniref:hypothetical protein n=1 Tax=Dyella sp. SG562 TaxID=2587017 RepID=UPI001421540A|nr:hypothetical protein [Dyella sp. SG562]NII74200.1 hypothetical protein [Dyella sp. SG562]
MNHYEGTVTSFSDLLTAIVAAATANGWTWNASKGTLVNGNSSVQLTASGTSYLRITGGVGVDGSGNLLAAAPNYSQIYGATATPVAWPVSYQIFVYDAPVMIAVAINHSVNYWQWMMWGLTVNLGLTGAGGDAPFVWASVRAGIGNAPKISINQGGNSGQGSFPHHPSIPFWSADSQGSSNDVNNRNAWLYMNEPASFTYSGGAVVWTPDGSSNTVTSRTGPSLGTAQRQPNAWNGQSILIRVRVQAIRPSQLKSWVAEVPHMRVIRNDNYDDNAVIALGGQQWKVISARCKNAAQSQREGADADHSGTYAIAMEYTS